MSVNTRLNRESSWRDLSDLRSLHLSDLKNSANVRHKFYWFFRIECFKQNRQHFASLVPIFAETWLILDHQENVEKTIEEKREKYKGYIWARYELLVDKSQTIRQNPP